VDVVLYLTSDLEIIAVDS